MGDLELVLIVIIIIMIVIILFLRLCKSSVPRSVLSDDFREMDRLWIDHVFFTREFLISSFTGFPGVSVTGTRLYQNQADLGNNLARIYGSEAGTEYTRLLNIHIDYAAAIVGDLKAGRNPSANITAWRANGRDIAHFLSSVTHGRINEVSMNADMTEHLDTTIAETQAIQARNWPTAMSTFVVVENHIVHMSANIQAGIRRDILC